MEFHLDLYALFFPIHAKRSVSDIAKLKPLFCAISTIPGFPLTMIGSLQEKPKPGGPIRTAKEYFTETTIHGFRLGKIRCEEIVLSQYSAHEGQDS